MLQFILQKNQIVMFGQPNKVETTSGGHFCISLLPEFGDSHNDCNLNLQKSDVILLLNSQGNEKNCQKEFTIRLQKQFGHASYEQSKSLLKMLVYLTRARLKFWNKYAKSDTCPLFKKPPPRPAVGLPLASDFNELLLHEWSQNVWYLHLIDEFYMPECCIHWT